MYRVLCTVWLMFVSTNVFAERDFSSEFLGYGMEGDLAGARQLLSEWEREKPQDPMLNGLKGMLIEWERERAGAGLKPVNRSSE